MGRRVSTTGGAALIIDYGNDGPSADSIQAIKGHSKVHIFHKPGECDVTGHVDFSAVKKAALEGSTSDAEAAAAYAALVAAAGSKRSPPGDGEKISPRHAALRAVICPILAWGTRCLAHLVALASCHLRHDFPCRGILSAESVPTNPICLQAESASRGRLHQLNGHGPITQSDFLHILGIRERIQFLIQSPNTTDS